MEQEKGLTIDIEKVVKAKAGDKVPKFLIRFLRKFLRVDFMNGLLVQGYTGQEFYEKAVEYLDVSVDVKGLENIDSDGGLLYTFASNHPLGGIDGVILASLLGKKFPNQKILTMVNEFLMNLPGLRDQSVPISKTGAQSRNLPEQIDKVFKSDEQVLIFPAGLCSRKYDGKIQDLPWKKTFINKSIETGRHVVPIHFKGQNSPRFYRFANICKALKLKFNFAMLLLPDEMYKGRHKRYELIIGKPIPPSFFDSSKTPLQWAEWMRQAVYEL